MRKSMQTLINSRLIKGHSNTMQQCNSGGMGIYTTVVRSCYEIFRGRGMPSYFSYITPKTYILVVYF